VFRDESIEINIFFNLKIVIRPSFVKINAKLKILMKQ